MGNTPETLDAALRAAASRVERPFLLEVRDGPRGLFARVAGTAFRDGMRRASREDGAAMVNPFLAEHTGDVACLDLGEVPAAAVAERLAELLHATPFPGAAEPFLALVHDPHDEDAALERARRTAGDARVDAFLASVTSLAGRRDADPDALTDRDALERLLRSHGLEAHAQRLAHEVAEIGLLLEPGTGPSHLGGPPRLPPGEPRPLSPRPLLTLPDGHEAPKALGLDPYEGQSYEEALETLIRLRDGGDDEHWFGGLQNTVQGFMPQPGTALLLQISCDEELGFEFGDGGQIPFRIPHDALAAGDWSRIFAVSDSY